VNAGATLAGVGNLSGDVLLSGGRLAPGNHAGPGVLTISGDVTFDAGSVYAIRIAGTDPDPAPAPASDQMMVGGRADLAGGAVEITAIDSRTSYVDGHTYAAPILTAANGLNGTEFASVAMAGNSAFITPTLSY